MRYIGLITLRTRPHHGPLLPTYSGCKNTSTLTSPVKRFTLAQLITFAS
jgi:hypothetical protein